MQRLDEAVGQISHEVGKIRFSQPARFAHNGLAGGSSPSSQPTEVSESLMLSPQFAGIFAGSNAGRAVSAAG